MSYTYLLDAGEESLAESFSDIPPCALSKSNHTAAASYSSDKETVSCHASPSGMMCAPLMAPHGEEGLTLSPLDSLARTLVPLARGLALTENEAGFGQKLAEPFAKLDPATRSWKIPQILLFADWERSLETWPRWGMMRGGACWALQTQERPTIENASGFLPTPLARDGHTCGALTRTKNGRYWNLRDWYHSLMGGTVGTPARRRKRAFWEWLMGWPENWTALEPLATDKFQQWLRSHGER